MNLYVGNLSCAVNEADLQLIFEGVGQIVFAKLIDSECRDRSTRGYALISLDDERQASSAIAALDGTYLKGLRLVVRPVPAQPMTLRASGASKKARAVQLGLRVIRNELVPR